MESQVLMTSLFHLSVVPSSCIHVIAMDDKMMTTQFGGAGIRLSVFHIRMKLFYHQALSFPSITVLFVAYFSPAGGKT